MTVYVIRAGRLVEKGTLIRGLNVPSFPMPMLSRFECIESPVTGEQISSWRQRDRDMAAAGAVDPRDLPAPTKGRSMQLKEHTDGRREPDAPFEWRDPA